jgi:VanZ family protein
VWAWSRAWEGWYRRLLPSYWIFLFLVTHLPKLHLGGPPSSDKFTHMAAYGTLAFLYWRFFESFERPLSARFVWGAALWLAVYALLDEATQPLVGRSADMLDWLCDMLGAGVALGLLEWRRRSDARSRRCEPGP